MYKKSLIIILSSLISYPVTIGISIEQQRLLIEKKFDAARIIEKEQTKTQPDQKTISFEKSKTVLLDEIKQTIELSANFQNLQNIILRNALEIKNQCLNEVISSSNSTLTTDHCKELAQYYENIWLELLPIKIENN